MQIRRNDLQAVLVSSPPPKDPESDYPQLARVADRLLTPIAIVGPDSTLRYANRVTGSPSTNNGTTN